MHAIAVVFNFVERLVALRRGVDQLSQLRADPSPFTCAESWTTLLDRSPLLPSPGRGGRLGLNHALLLLLPAPP